MERRGGYSPNMAEAGNNGNGNAPLQHELAGMQVLANEDPSRIDTVKPPKNEGVDRLILSNRLPVALKTRADGSVYFEPTIGGMASAVRQAQGNDENRSIKDKVVWMGWPGITENEGLETALHSVSQKEPFDLEPVFIPHDEFNDYYGTIANGFLWPTAHSMTNRFTKEKVGEPQKYEPLSQNRIDQAWTNYEKVNDRFATQSVNKAKRHTLVEIHDYHLLLAGEKMRQKGFEGKISFFLHIPFPTPDIFSQTPHAKDIAKALLSCDVIGFQTEQDKDNFATFVKQELDVQIDPVSNPARREHFLLAKTQERTARIEAFPISIDPDEFRHLAQEPDVIKHAEEIKERYGDKKIFFTGGRLDYSKGMVESLAGYYRLLEQCEQSSYVKSKTIKDLREKMIFVLATPLSRTDIPAYQKYAHQIQIMVDKINTRFSTENWTPVDHIGALDQKGITAYYRASDTVVVASRADGMNLVAKEAVAVASILPEGRTPVLLLSKGSGASHELTDAIQFDTNWRSENIQQITDALYQAATMPEEQRRRRLEANIQKVEDNTIFDWAQKRDDALRAA